MIITALDFLSLVVISWTSYAALESGHEVDDWWRALLTASLIGIMVSSFVGAIAVIMDPPALHWYIRGVIYSSMLFGVWFYERRYGVGRHVRMAKSCLARRLANARARINGRRVPR